MSPFASICNRSNSSSCLAFWRWLLCTSIQVKSNFRRKGSPVDCWCRYRQVMPSNCCSRKISGVLPLSMLICTLARDAALRSLLFLFPVLCLLLDPQACIHAPVSAPECSQVQTGNFRRLSTPRVLDATFFHERLSFDRVLHAVFCVLFAYYRW